MTQTVTPVALPDKFKWILSKDNPFVILELLKYYGLKEVAGAGSNSIIMQWAKDLGLVRAEYPGDHIAWCGLGTNHALWVCKYPIPKGMNCLSAKAILDVDGYVHVPKGEECYGDILVYKRPGGHHEAINTGENKDCFLNFGCNQSDKVGFAFIEKSRLIGCRRPVYKTRKPEKVILTFTGELSHNEA